MKSEIKKSLKILTATTILVALVILSVTHVVVGGIIDGIEKTARATIAANTLKYKKGTAQLKAKHKKNIARIQAKHKKDLAKTKTKERGKRWFASIPIIGTVFAIWTSKEEYDDYSQWHDDYPNGSPKEYAKYKADLFIEP